MKKFIVMIMVWGISINIVCLPGAIAQPIDQSVFNKLLQKYVSDGQVDYIEWKNNDFNVFEEYINNLENVSLDTLTIYERKAFWINTYNAITIYAVLKRIPSNKLLARVFSVQVVAGFFDRLTYIVAGEDLTLNDIENKKLRKKFNDPLTHFAIVCASSSCPEIQDSIFTAADLVERLEGSARVFIQDKDKNRLDKKNNTLHLSEIFRWYYSDFIGESVSVIDYVQKYLEPADSYYMSRNNIKIKYLFYNWLVNIKH